MTLDPAAHRVTRSGRRITLSAREYAVLEYLLRNPGQVLTRDMIAEHVWGPDYDAASNIVDVYVGYLRRKLDGELAIDLVGGVVGIPLKISGTVEEPVLSMTAGAVTGAAVGTAVLPGVGTAIGARVGQQVERLLGEPPKASGQSPAPAGKPAR